MTIKRVKSGYRVVSHAGKNLGTSPTRAGALKRLGQVEYFKHHARSGQAMASRMKKKMS